MSEPVNIRFNTETATPQPTQQTIGATIAESSYRYDALRDADINGLSSARRPTLVTLFGISECGKTTFVGSLFAILCRRPQLLKSTFIDSDTLTGFQRRVHTRYLSEKGLSEQPRTQRRAGSILNVVLGDEHGDNQRMVVFSDLSGEVYNDAASNDDVVLQQKAVKYADKLIIFVDAEKLLPTKNNAYKASFQSLLTRFKGKDMFTSETEYFLVFNKVDLVENAINEATKGIENESELKRKHDEITNRWEQRKQSVLDIVSPLVAVPSDNIYEICSKGIKYDHEDYGLIALFNRLIKEKTPASLSPKYNWIQNLVNKK
ncbi:TRAFAC clade GTPase domain-containing protein [Alistipes communis]|mgnify:FL=1|uniref:TRAFAC clade GTPase domain-containing protein n=1 Tax=Alistipes communis TaxID=2585118 RepID=UPI0030781DA3